MGHEDVQEELTDMLGDLHRDAIISGRFSELKLINHIGFLPENTFILKIPSLPF